MNREEFCNNVKEKLMDRYAIAGWKVRILWKGYTSEDAKELNLIRETNEKYYRNQDEILGGNFIILERKTGNKNGMTRFEVDYLIDSFNKEGWDFVFRIVDANIEAVDKSAIGVGELNEYENCKYKLIVRLLNYEKNKRALEGKVYKVIGDIAMVLYLLLQVDDDRLLYVKVAKDKFDKWDMSFDEVIQQALRNSCELCPPRVYSDPDIAEHPGFEDGMYLEPGAPALKLGKRGGDAFTAYRCSAGAVSFFYQGVAEKIAEAVGNEDYYVAFTSVEDFQIERCSDLDSDEIRKRIMCINMAFPDDEMLTEMVYRYNVKTRELEPVD